MTPENLPIQVVGSSAKARSRYSGLDPRIEERPTSVAIIRLRRSPPVRLGAVNLLTAPRQSRPLLLLGEGLAQLLLLLLGQVGRDDLEVVLPELVYNLVRRGGPASERKKRRGPRGNLISHLLDEIVANAHVCHRTRERAHPRADRSPEEGHEEDQPEQKTPESATHSSSA